MKSVGLLESVNPVRDVHDPLRVAVRVVLQVVRALRVLPARVEVLALAEMMVLLLVVRALRVRAEMLVRLAEQLVVRALRLVEVVWQASQVWLEPTRCLVEQVAWRQSLRSYQMLALFG